MPGFGNAVGTLVKQRYMLSVIGGRSTYKLTWGEIIRLYRLTLGQNTQARYNVCPTYDNNGTTPALGSSEGGRV